jgi:hypothetical protein
MQQLCLSTITLSQEYFIMLCFMQEVNFMMLDASDGRLLEGFEKLLGRIMVPALRNQKVHHG